MSSANKKTVKFIFTAQILRLSINKNIKFLTKIGWKRHNNKTQTQLQHHEHGFSTFNQKLQLEINLVWDEDKQIYEDKNTQIVAVIEYEGKVKSGGYMKYNISQVVNNNLKNKLQTIKLTQCPDPNAFVEITFDYSSYGQNLDTSMSVLNVSSRDLNMSRVDFNDDKLSLQINRINSTVNKLNDLTSKVKNKQNQVAQNIPKLKTTIQMLQGEKSTLKKQFQSLQKSTKKTQTQYHQQKMALLKQVKELQKQLEKRQKQSRSQYQIEAGGKEKNREEDEKDKAVLGKYKKLYEQALEEIQQLKSANIRQSMGFKATFDDVQQIANFQNSDQDDEQSSKNRKVSKPSRNRDKNASESQVSIQEELTIEELKKKNDELQQNVADMSYKIAALFNSSFQYGGAKLLDYLQTAIGLTEKN